MSQETQSDQDMRQGRKGVTMDIQTYERKINDIIMKCPIEAGVEILVYNLLDEFIDSGELSLVDI